MKNPARTLTDEERQRACSMLAAGMARSSAAKFAGCRRLDLEAEIKRDPAFRQRIHESELRTELKAMNAVTDAGGDPKQWRAAAWALERLFPRRYGASKREAVPPAALRKVIAQQGKAADPQKLVRKQRAVKTKRAGVKKNTGARAKARRRKVKKASSAKQQ